MSIYVSAMSVSKFVLLVCIISGTTGNPNLNSETRGLLDVYYDEQTVICANTVCSAGERCGFDGMEAKCIPIPVDTRRTNNNRLSRAPRTQSASQTSGLAKPQRTIGVNYRGQNTLSDRPRNNCEQPGDRGRCPVPRQQINRYYYSQRQRKCVMFEYSGCGGNSNNFKMYKDCFDECILPRISTVTQDRNPTQVESRQKSGSLLAMNTNRRVLGDISNGNLGGSLLLAPVTGLTQGRGGFPSGAAMLGQSILSRQCFIRLEKGTCQGRRSRRWYFDTRTSSCERFIYTGCGGNPNNFMSLKECEDTCEYSSQNSLRMQNPSRLPSSSIWSAGDVIEPPSFCLLHPNDGSCNGDHLRYYYNKIKGTCEPFHYKGCAGNQNNFKSVAECKQFCVIEGATKRSDSLALPSGESTIPKLPSHPPPAKVSHQGSIPDHCNEDYDAGPCFAALPRYYYNNVTSRCELFLYGGCAGNGNKFESKDACHRDCIYHESLVRINVKLPAKAPRSQTKALKNSRKLTDSQFVTESKTTAVPPKETTIGPNVAGSSPPDLCYLPAQTGCDAKFSRFFYNSQSGRCERFQYGGCRPNENNFMTMQDCQNVCMNSASQFIFDQSSNSQHTLPLNVNNAEYVNKVDELLAPFII